MKNYILFLGFLLFISFGHVYAQVPVNISSEIQVIDGKKYYIHEVEKGQTLYSISKTYKCSIDEIKKINRLSDNTLPEGYLLKIPFNNIIGNDSQNNSTISSGTTIHIVQKGESLSIIARKYNTTVDNLRTLNKGISDALKPQQKLNVPKLPEAKIVENLDTNIHIVQDGETLYGIAKKYLLSVSELKSLNPDISENINIGDKIKVIRSENARIKDISTRFKCEHGEKLKEYNVALLIPFYFDKGQYREFNTDNKEKNLWYENKSFTYIQFYEGLKMALDSMKKAGLNVNLYVYDLDDSEQKFNKIINNPVLEKMHLIIGPFEEIYLDELSAFSYEHQIPIVSCFLSGEIHLKEINPYFFNPITSVKLQIKSLADYFAKNKRDENLIIAYQAGGMEEKAALMLDSALREKNYNHQIVVNLTGKGLSAATKNFVKGNKENILVSMASGDMYVGNMIRSLNEFKENYKITLFGLPGWLDYDIIDLEFLEFQNTHFFSSSFANFENSSVREFVKNFQKNYKIDPNRQAYFGFDIGLYFLTALKDYGPTFYKCIDEIEVNTLTTKFEFEFTFTEGFKNKGLYIYRMKDFQLLEVE
ncbi:MAG: LysM peptidoglycan-binding domain-containing protein [Bacteroidales bacterium]|nr:LysM peptidoglycan-binding domain-containing protein [Bacteroidales bacterium]